MTEIIFYQKEQRDLQKSINENTVQPKNLKYLKIK